MNITEAKLEPIIDVRLSNFTRTCAEVMFYLSEAFKDEFVLNKFYVQTYYKFEPYETFDKKPGTKHKFLCCIPIDRENLHEYEEWSTHSRMDAGSAIFIYYETIVVNDKTHSEYFDVQTSNLYKNDNQKYGGERILYHSLNGNSSLFVDGHITLSTKAYLQIHNHVESVLKDIETLRRIEKFKSEKLTQPFNASWYL
jgi:hypothetical protein